MALSYKIKFIRSKLFEMLLYFCITFAVEASDILSMKTLVIAVLLVLIAFVLLGVKVLFVKGGTFPSGHVHSSKPLRDRGIGCAHQSDGGDS